MNLLVKRMSELYPDWNKRILTYEDGVKLAESRGTFVRETDLIDDLGEYRVHRSQPFIFIHSFTTADYKPWVLWHEVGHDLFHTPLTCQFSLPSTRRKVEIEANVIAAIALIPLYIAKTKKFHEIQEEFDYPRELIMFRKRILENHQGKI